MATGLINIAGSGRRRHGVQVTAPDVSGVAWG